MAGFRDEELVIHRTQGGSSEYSVVINDDGRVAYAYLLRGPRIVADVWLYNRGPAPAEPEWHDKTRFPPRNPHDFALEEPIEPIRGEGEIEVLWHQIGESFFVEIYFREVLWGRLVPESKTGWSRLAKKDGPLAKVM